MLNESDAEIFTVTINKQPAQLSGIYIKEGIISGRNSKNKAVFVSRIVIQDNDSLLTKNIPTNLDGNPSDSSLMHLQPGDQILSVNGFNLNTYPSLDSIVTLMSKASSLTLKLARWKSSTIVNDENFCTDSGRENINAEFNWPNCEKKSLIFPSNQGRESTNKRMSLFFDEDKNLNTVENNNYNASENNIEISNSSPELVHDSLFQNPSMKRTQVENPFDEPSLVNRNLDIRRLQLEQPSADDSNDSGLSSENSHNSRDMFCPRYNDLANHPYIQGVYQKQNIQQRKLQNFNEQTNRNYLPPAVYDTGSKFDLRCPLKYYINPQNNFHSTQTNIFPLLSSRENNFKPIHLVNQHFPRKQTCSNPIPPLVPREDKSTQCCRLDLANAPSTNSCYKRYPLDYNSDSEIAAYENTNEYYLSSTDKYNSINRTASLRNSNFFQRNTARSNRNSLTDENMQDFQSSGNNFKKPSVNYRSSSKDSSSLRKSKDFSVFYNNENDKKQQIEKNCATDMVMSSTHGTQSNEQSVGNNLYNSLVISEPKFPAPPIQNTGSLLMERYIPNESKDFRLLQSERWMKPIRSSDQPPGIAGILVVNVIAGCSLQSSHSLFRDLYCVLEIDSMRKARSMIRTSTEVFEWDEIFEIDLWNSHFLSILLYQWDPKTHHRLCFYGGINLLTFIDYFQQNVAGADKVILQLEPKGLLYLEMAFLNWELSFIRQTNNRDNSVFGRPISQIRSVVSSNNAFDCKPFVITLCVEEIERRGLDNVGLYRLCGAAKLKAHLRQLLETYHDFTDMSSSVIPDIHVITSVLKDFLRELPEPLLTTALYRNLVKSSFHSDIYDNPEGPMIMITIFNSLPQVNRESLIYFIDHLIRLAQKNDINKMTISELSTNFASLLLQPSCEQLNNYQNLIGLARQEIEFLQYLLTQWPTIKQKLIFGKSTSNQRKTASSSNVNNASSCSIAIQTSDDSHSNKTQTRNCNSSTPKKSLSTSQTHQNKSILRNSSSRATGFYNRSLHDTSNDELL